MRAIVDMDNIQIEVTNACHNSCSNCTRFCGHKKPYFMPLDSVVEALDACEGYPKMVGIMGGEPLMHPEFEQICEEALKRFPRERLGLWTCLPLQYERYKDAICRTFGNILINDHSRDDIYHCPILVAAEEVYKDRAQLFYIIDKCWLQNSWSAAINPKGAFFCEIAASMALLFDEPKDEAWPVEKGWYWRVPKDYREQIERWCPRCGVSLPLPRRVSVDGRDDISLSNLVRLKEKSWKVKKGLYVQSDLKLVKNPEPMAAYKDHDWRQRVANKFGIYLTINERRYWDPLPMSSKLQPRSKTFDRYKEKYNATQSGEVTAGV